MPEPWTDWHEPVPHWLGPPGVHTKAHFLSLPEERAHWGVAVSPAGTSVGQALLAQSGAQKLPAMPVTCTAVSSERQPLAGSP
jgi:hypothetical protein